MAMSGGYDRKPGGRTLVQAKVTGDAGTPGKQTLVDELPDHQVVQRTATDGVAAAGELGDGADLHTAAARGIAGPRTSLPHLDIIQRSFGRHDVTGIAAHVDDNAAGSSRAIGAEAYATGSHVAFASHQPSLRTAAHEAAHVVQQRSGIHLKGGIGESGDPYERHADAVADTVVRGESAQSLLDAVAQPARGAMSSPAVQRQDAPAAPPASPLAQQVEQVWRDTSAKGRVFDVLRARSPVVDPVLDQALTRIFAAGSDDLWLAQTIVRHGPEPLWPDAALDERHRRQVDHQWAREAGNIEATIATTAAGRPVESFYFPGQTNERALIIGGVHGSEQGGIEVVEMLLADMRAATRSPYYTVIVVPVVFPDNAAARRREGTTPTNRNFPSPGTSLGGATGADAVPRDASGTGSRPGREILAENVALIRLIDRFQPSRICTVHGTHDRNAAGVFSDRHTVSAGARARARAGNPDPAAAAAAEASLDQNAATRTAADSAMAIEMARGIRTAGQDNAVRGNQLSRTPTSGWSGEVPGGTSLGGWGPRDVSEGGAGDRPSISVITVEVPENHRSTDRTGRAAEARRLELLAFRDVIRDIFLGPPRSGTPPAPP